jgi:hypothetical protein
MDSSQIFEPVFRSIPKIPRATGDSACAAIPGRIFPRTLPGASAGGWRRVVLSLLEHLDLCRAPRIISAECLVGDTQYKPVGNTTIPGDAGVFTDLAV